MRIQDDIKDRLATELSDMMIIDIARYFGINQSYVWRQIKGDTKIDIEFLMVLVSEDFLTKTQMHKILYGEPPTIKTTTTTTQTLE